MSTRAVDRIGSAWAGVRSATWKNAFAVAVLCLLVLIGIAEALPARFDQLETEWHVLQLWPDAEAQSRAQLGDELYDALTQADALLPRQSSVLLVTRGEPPRGDEYGIFHRFMYHLAPRPVWWVNPAAPDGTWESRWWIQTPNTFEALRAFAQSKTISYLIFYRAQPPAQFENSMVLTPNYRMVALDDEPIRSPAGYREAPANPFGLMPGVLLIFVAGFGVIALSSRLGYKPGWIEAAGLAWPLGTGLVTVTMLWLNALGLSLTGQIALSAAATLVGLVGAIALKLRVRRGLTVLPRSPSLRAKVDTRTRLLPPVLIALILLQIAYVAILAAGRPLIIWDSWVNWAIKARIIYREGGISPALYAEPSRTVTQLDYPLLVPLAEAWTFAWAGATDDRLAGIPAALLFASLLGVCYGALRQLGAGRALALASVAAIALIPNLGGTAALVFADFPLTVYATIAGIYLVIWLETRSRGSLVIAALAAGLLMWTKREGLFLLVALMISIVLVNGLRRKTWQAIAALATAAAVLSGPWWVLMAMSGIGNVAFMPVTLSNLRANIGRLRVIEQLERPMLLDAAWSYVWPLSAAFALLNLSRRRAADVLILTPFLYLGVMSLGYVFSDYVPYEQHILSSAGRLIAHVVSLPVLWMACRHLRLDGGDATPT